jgi:RNA polymerase sigma-70 factor (ECF subfamily)
LADRLQGAAFEELAMPLFDSLYNFAHWLTQSREDAEDLVQETFAKALKGFGTFQPGTNFRAWMFRILRNTFLTSRSGLAATATKLPLNEEEDEMVLTPSPRTPESLLLEKLQAETLQNAIAGLPVEYREVLLLADVEEMSYQEIADAVGIPMGTVMSRLSRARRAVRAQLQGGERKQGASK